MVIIYTSNFDFSLNCLTENISHCNLVALIRHVIFNNVLENVLPGIFVTKIHLSFDVR